MRPVLLPHWLPARFVAGPPPLDQSATCLPASAEIDRWWREPSLHSQENYEAGQDRKSVMAQPQSPVQISPPGWRKTIRRQHKDQRLLLRKRVQLRDQPVRLSGADSPERSLPRSRGMRLFPSDKPTHSPRKPPAVRARHFLVLPTGEGPPRPHPAARGGYRPLPAR